MLYRAGSVERGRKRLRDSAQEIKGVHQLIWPFHAVPDVCKKQAHGKDEIVLSAVPTSYFFSTLVFMFRSTKRAPKDRAYAARVLRFFMEKLAGRTLTFLRYHSNGSHSFNSVDIDAEGFVPDCWTEEYCRHVGTVWDFELMDTAKPWIQSTRTKPLFSDFVLFSLDPPPAKGTSRHRKTIKDQLVRCGLYLISQVAESIDSRIFSLTQRPDVARHRVIGGKRPRESTLQANATMAECAELLFSKQAQRDSLLNSSKLVISPRPTPGRCNSAQ